MEEMHRFGDGEWGTEFPCLLWACHLLSTSVCSPIWTLPESHHLEVLMEVLLHRDD